MMEERSSQLLLERLQSSSLKKKERRSTLVLRVALFSLAGAFPMEAKWTVYSSAVPGMLLEVCVRPVGRRMAQTKVCSLCRAAAQEGLDGSSPSHAPPPSCAEESA